MVAVTVIVGQGCSAVRCQWRDAALQGSGPGAADSVLPKRLAVVGWAAPNHGPPVGNVLARVAADFVKLHRNYLVYETRTIQQHWAEACRGKVQGVLLVRALSVGHPDTTHVALDLAAEMYACSDGALLWRVQADGVRATQDAALAQLTDSYAAELGEEGARQYVAPSFGLLQDAFDGLPDVSLNDDEVSEKIELGQTACFHPSLARL